MNIKPEYPANEFQYHELVIISYKSLILKNQFFIWMSIAQIVYWCTPNDYQRNGFLFQEQKKKSYSIAEVRRTVYFNWIGSIDCLLFIQIFFVIRSFHRSLDLNKLMKEK